jgi:hypothetical protein
MPTPEPVSDEFGDALMRVSPFGQRYRHIYAKDHQIRWLLRDRATNGLLDYGAVVEVFANGSRPSLLIHPPRWFAWMRAGGSHAPRRNP